MAVAATGSLKALLATGDRALVQLADIPEPQVAPGEALIEVHAISINRGELHRLHAATAGWRPGWDFAGKVLAADGGVQVGANVFGLLHEGAWAQRIAAPIAHLAVLPDEADLTEFASTPVAGLTALRLLRLAPALSGKSVLVIGAAGGVGRFLVQLARMGGATVYARVGRPDRANGLPELGAHQVYVGAQRPQRGFDVILDSVGGTSLEQAFDLVGRHGLIVTYGNSEHRDSQLRVNAFYDKQATLRGYHLLHDVADEPPRADLAHVADLVLRGQLCVQHPAVTDWTNASAVLEALYRRMINGKAVLTVAR